MNRVIINPQALLHNIVATGKLMERHGSSWTVVTKVLCGHAESLRALQLLGIRSMGDSRLVNMKAIERIIPDFEAWYLRIPDFSSIEEVIELCDVSLNSELEIIKALNEEAGRQHKTHRIIIMIELGDLREGILPSSLVEFYEQVFRLPNIEVLGIGANLGCLSGIPPSVDLFTQLMLYRELLELKFQRRLPMISAGSTATLPLLMAGGLPREINHFRIGEAIFLGSDLINEGLLPGYRDDVIILEAEIAEIKEKSLVPLGDSASIAPFVTDNDAEPIAPGQRGFRALVSIGHLDTDISGLTPVNDDYQISGASSDITAINIGESSRGLKVGDSITFRVNYSALLRLMSSKYIDKVFSPSLEHFKRSVDDAGETAVDPVIERFNAEEAEEETAANEAE